MVDPNTRQGKRTPVTLKIKFKSETLEQFIERYAVDVSQGGIFIRTKEPLAVGTQMRFEFQLRDASPLIAGEGTVVWTRENDPSRPAIAPGMGVRFDRLAEGSQTVLERILAEKAKQAPQRSAPESSKPPMFADTPTRVAPAPVQDALLNNSDNKRKRPDSYGDHTPLPKATPWHSDADEFPDEAFEEATKVRALDELIAATASDSTKTTKTTPAPSADGARGARADSTVSDPPRAESVIVKQDDAVNRDSAPGLPSPPETERRSGPRILDAATAPKIESPALPPVDATRTRLGVEPAKVATRAAAQDIKNAPTKATGMRAVASEGTTPTRHPETRKSKAPLLILLLVLVACGAAAVWFFMLRKPAEDSVATQAGSSSGSAVGSQGSAVAMGSDGSAGSGSAVEAMGSNTGSGSAVAMAGSGSGAGSGSDAAVKADLVDTMITANAEKATIELVGASQSGPSPLKARLEKGKAYKAHVTAPGYLPLDVDVQGGGDKVAVKLTAKPRIVSLTTDPPGALIFVDSGATGHSTPFDVELTKAQASKKTIRIMLRKNGFKQVEKVIELAKFTEDAAQMIYKDDEKLVVQIQMTPNPNNGNGNGNTNTSSGGTHTGTGAGSDHAGSAAQGSGTTGSGTTSGSAGTGSTGTGSTGAGSGTTGSGTTSGSAGSSAGSGSSTTSPPTTSRDGAKPGTGTGSSEPEPDFVKRQ